MSEDRGFLVGGFDQLLAAPAPESENPPQSAGDPPPNVGGDQWIEHAGADSLEPYALAVGHWSYSVRFENYPPLPEVSLAWLYSYLPPPSVQALGTGDSTFVPGHYTATEYNDFIVDQDRWLYPDGIDTLETGYPCLTDPDDVDPYRIYAPPSPFELVFRLCYAPPTTISYGVDHRGLIVSSRWSDFFESGEIIVGGEDFVDPEGIDFLAPGDMCLLREFPSLFWALYPPEPSIDFVFAGCYVPPREVWDSGPVVIDYSAVYDREMIVGQRDTLETGPIVTSPTQFAQITESDQFGTSRVCVTAPYVSRWYIYPPPPSIDLIFRCSYRRPRQFDQWGPVVISAIYEIEPLAPALGVQVSGFDQLQTDLPTVAIVWSPAPIETTPEPIEPALYGTLDVDRYERSVTPFDTDTLLTGTPGLVNTNQTTRVDDLVSLETGDVGVWLWERGLLVTGLDFLGIDPIWPRVELADRLLTPEPADTLLTSVPELFIPVPIEPTGLDSFTDEAIAEEGEPPAIALFLSRHHRGVGPVEHDSLATGPLFIGTEQTFTVLWAATLETDLPAMIRYQEVFPQSSQQTLYDLPTFISWDAIAAHALDSFEQTMPSLRNEDREIRVGSREQFAADPPILRTDKFVVFRGHMETGPQTQYGNNLLANVHRSLAVATHDSLDTGVDTFLTKTPTAAPDGLDATQHGRARVSHGERSITPLDYIPPRQQTATVTNAAFAPLIAGRDSLLTGEPTVILGERRVPVDSAETAVYGSPLMGFEREIIVPRGFQWHFEEYGQPAIGQHEQPLAPTGLDQSIQGYGIFLREVFAIAAVRSYKDQETEYAWPAIENVDRFREVRGPDSLIFGLPSLANELQLSQPYGLDSLALGPVTFIWAREETLRVGARLSPETEYGWWRIDNELGSGPGLQIIQVWQLDEHNLQEVVPNPLTEYENPSIRYFSITPDGLDSLETGEVRADGHLTELYEGVSHFRAGSPRVEYFHRSFEVEMVEDADEELIGEPRVDPAYISLPDALPMTNARHDGAAPYPGRDYDPSPPTIANEHRSVAVSSTHNDYFPAYGPVTVARGFGRSIIDVGWRTLTQFGELELWPHTRRTFVSEHNALQTGEIVVEQGPAVIVPSDQFAIVGDTDSLQPGVSEFQNLHREILVTGLSHTVFGNNEPMVHFERTFEPTGSVQFIGGTPWVSMDPQEPLIDTEQDCLEVDTFPGFSVVQKPQHLTPVPGDTLETGFIRMRREEASSPGGRQWDCPPKS